MHMIFDPISAFEVVSLLASNHTNIPSILSFQIWEADSKSIGEARLNSKWRENKFHVRFENKASKKENSVGFQWQWPLALKQPSIYLALEEGDVAHSYPGRASLNWFIHDKLVGMVTFLILF